MNLSAENPDNNSEFQFEWDRNSPSWDIQTLNSYVSLSIPSPISPMAMISPQAQAGEPGPEPKSELQLHLQEGAPGAGPCPITPLLMPSTPIATTSELTVPTCTTTTNVTSNSWRRKYREEWKTVSGDNSGMIDRQAHLIIDSNDPWGMWCAASTLHAKRFGTKTSSLVLLSLTLTKAEAFAAYGNSSV